MLPKVTLDSEQVFYLLNFIPAMKDVSNPQKLMEIMATVHNQLYLENHAANIANQIEKALTTPPTAPDEDGNVPDVVIQTGSILKFRVVDEVHVPPGEVNPYKVRAIKCIRQLTGMGLKDAKDTFETQIWIPASMLTNPNMGAGTLELYFKKNDLKVDIVTVN